MKLVIIESPYAGDIESNKKYLIKCMQDSFRRGEAPFASHKLYTDVLDDNDSVERELGIKAGFAWGIFAYRVVVYCDYGISNGMKLGIINAFKHEKELVFRWIKTKPVLPMSVDLGEDTILRVDSLEGVFIGSPLSSVLLDCSSLQVR